MKNTLFGPTQKTVISLLLTLFSAPSYALDSHLKLFYVPWILVLLALIILIPIFFKLSSLNRNNKLSNTKNIDQWRSILTLPIFIGGVGTSLTLFSLLFAFTSYSDKLVIPILLPLTGLSIIFILFAKNSYSLLKQS